MSPFPLLAADQRRVEIDLDLETHAVIGAKLAPRTAMLDANRLGYADVAALDAERHQTDLFDRIDEGHRAAVHDRHFSAIDFDQNVVEAQCVDRGHHVFDRRDGARRGKAEDGAEIGVADLRGNRAKFGDFAILVHAIEYDAGVGFSWVEGDRNVGTRMNADSRKRNRT
jgi:hypothetical protein